MCLFKVINKQKFVYLVHLFSIYIVTNHDRKENKCGGRTIQSKISVCANPLPPKSFSNEMFKMMLPSYSIEHVSYVQICFAC